MGGRTRAVNRGSQPVWLHVHGRNGSHQAVWQDGVSQEERVAMADPHSPAPTPHCAPRERQGSPWTSVTLEPPSQDSMTPVAAPICAVGVRLVGQRGQNRRKAL